MKKRNLLLTLALAAVMGLGTLGVDAKGLDKSLCKDQKVYTNYYLFADAVVYQNGKIVIDRDYPTQGNYANNFNSDLTGQDLKDQTKGKDNKIYYEMGEVAINLNGSDTLDTMKLNTFWSNVKQGDHTDSATNTKYFYEHTWSRVENGKIMDTYPTENIFRKNEYTVDVLSDSSFKLATAPTIDFVGLNDDGKLKFQINRKYQSGVSQYTSNAVRTLRFDSDTTNDYVTQPAAYYIQYCKLADGKTAPVEGGNNKLPNNPKTGVATDVAAFTLVAAAAVTGLVIARKKGLFRQL